LVTPNCRLFPAPSRAGPELPRAIIAGKPRRHAPNPHPDHKKGTAAAGILGAVKRKVCGFQKRIGINSVQWRDHDSDARTDIDSLSLDREWLCKNLDDARGERCCIFGRLERADQHCELVSAKPCCNIDSAAAIAEPSRDFDEHRIARGMSKRVVDGLEAVEIDIENGHPLTAPDSGLGPFQVFKEERAVGKIGQGIVARMLADLRFVLPLLGDVLMRRHPAAIAHRMMSDRDRPPVAHFNDDNPGNAAIHERLVLL
jgi:hypothetical protein